MPDPMTVIELARNAAVSERVRRNEVGALGENKRAQFLDRRGRAIDALCDLAEAAIAWRADNAWAAGPRHLAEAALLAALARVAPEE